MHFLAVFSEFPILEVPLIVQDVFAALASFRGLRGGVATVSGDSPRISGDGASAPDASALRRAWCQQLGISRGSHPPRETLASRAAPPQPSPAVVATTSSFFGGLWRTAQPATVSAAPITVGNRVRRRLQLFASPEQLIVFVEVCLRCKPSQLYLKYLMCGYGALRL